MKRLSRLMLLGSLAAYAAGGGKLAKTEEIDWARAEAAMRRSLVRMKVAGR